MAKRHFTADDGDTLITLRRKALAAIVAALHAGDDLDALEQRYVERHEAITGSAPGGGAWPALERRARLVVRMNELRERGM